MAHTTSTPHEDECEHDEPPGCQDWANNRYARSSARECLDYGESRYQLTLPGLQEDKPKGLPRSVLLNTLYPRSQFREC